MSLTDTEENYVAKIDIFSQNRDSSSASMANANYYIKLPSFVGNKRYIKIYVENFNISLKSITLEECVCVRLTTSGQINSYDTSTNGPSDILITAIPNVTSDYGLSVSNNLYGINVGSLPIGNVNIRITNAHNTDLALVNNVNDYNLQLRVEAYN